MAFQQGVFCLCFQSNIYVIRFSPFQIPPHLFGTYQFTAVLWPFFFLVWCLDSMRARYHYYHHYHHGNVI